MSVVGNSEEARATPRGAGEIAVAGVLTFNTVPSVFAQSAGWLHSASGRVVVDLKDVRHADSAGVALLVEWLRHAQARNVDLQLTNMPEQVRSLIRVSGLSRALGLDGRD